MNNLWLKVFFEAAWPLIAAGTVGLALLVFYRFSPTGRTIRSTIVFYLPGILLISMSVIGSLIISERISSLWVDYRETVQRQLTRRSEELIDLIMTGRYVELNSTLARIRESASLADLSIRGMDDHLLAKSQNYRGPSSDALFTIPLVRKDIDGSAVKWGVLSYQTDPSQMHRWVEVQRKRWMFISGMVVLIVSFFSIISSRLIGRLFNGLHSSLIELQNRIATIRDPRDLAKVLNLQEPLKSELIEEAILLSAFKKIGGQLSKLYKSTAELEADARMGRTIAQVVHDIRSPLSLIQAVIKKESDRQNENARLLAMGCDRIKAITSDLLTQYRQERNGREESSMVSPFALLIESIVAEKRIIHERSEVSLQFLAEERAWLAFVSIDPKEFCRAISNLIENACEASSPKSTVTIEIQCTAEYAIIMISDEGCGMPTEVVERLGEKGFSVRKVGGNGLGVHHAKELFLRANGRFEVSSSLGVGTNLRMALPIASRPEHYCDPYELKDGRAIVGTSNAELAEFLRTKYFGPAGRWQQTLKDLGSVLDTSKDDYVLIDIDTWVLDEVLLEIGTLLPAKRTILVTTNVMDQKLQDTVMDLEFRLLPTAWLAMQRSKRMSYDTPFDLVLIDDDPLVHMTWKFGSQKLNKKLLTVDSINDFRQAAIAKTTPIYIDLHLGKPFLGISIASELHNEGYRDLHFATGDATFQQSPDFIRSVSGKEFPLDS